MLEQLTIFDCCQDTEGNATKIKNDDGLYALLLSPGIKFIRNDIRSLKDIEMLVIDEETGRCMFGITIKYGNDSCIRFSYSAIDKYWFGSYTTNNYEKIKKSILTLSSDIRNEWG